MKAYFLRHKKLHLWLLADLGLLAAFWLCRSSRPVMTLLATGAAAVRRAETGPDARRRGARLCVDAQFFHCPAAGFWLVRQIMQKGSVFPRVLC